MNRIVREHYPVADLPEDLREGFPRNAMANVTVEVVPAGHTRPPTLKELLALRRPPYRETQDIVDDIRRDRDAWDD